MESLTLLKDLNALIRDKDEGAVMDFYALGKFLTATRPVHYFAIGEEGEYYHETTEDGNVTVDFNQKDEYLSGIDRKSNEHFNLAVFSDIESYEISENEVKLNLTDNKGIMTLKIR